jgi:aspartate kinase
MAAESRRRVQKFGGAALRDGRAVGRACELVRAHGGARPVVVVSALEGVTTELERLPARGGDASALRIRHRTLLRELDLPGDLLDRYLRELAQLLDRPGADPAGPLPATKLDHLMSLGERMSARVVAAALRERGVPATPVDAWDLGLVVAAGSARLLSGSLEAAARALEEVPGVPVVTGFLAADERGNLTTLGRNGSDVTALLLAGAIDAEVVHLWKGVAGIQSADPRLVEHARTLPRVGYEEARELALHGAAVLHADAARLAARHRLGVRLLDVRDPEGARGGTELVDSTPSRGPIAVAHRTGLLEACLHEGSARALAALLEELAAALESPEARGEQGPWLESRGDGARLVVADREPVRAALARAGASVDAGRSALTLVGREIGGDASLLARTAEVLERAGVAARPLAPHDADARSASQAWLLDESDLRRAVGAVHDTLLVRPSDPLGPPGAPTPRGYRAEAERAREGT